MLIVLWYFRVGSGHMMIAVIVLVAVVLVLVVNVEIVVVVRSVGNSGYVVVDFR